MNIRKFLGKLVCIVSVINIMVLNVKGGVIVNAEEIVDIVDGDNNIELKDAEKIAWYHILNMINLDNNSGLWSYSMFIKDEQEIYGIDNSINAYCIKYTDNENNDCGYVLVGANDKYAPIIEYSTSGSFCFQDLKTYCIGNEDINNNLQNISNYNTDKYNIENKLLEVEQENFSDEWKIYYDFDKKSLSEQVETIDDYFIEIMSSNPPTSGKDPINRPFDFENGYKDYDVVDVYNYNLNYFCTTDFPNYNSICSPTAGTNLMLYWYNRGSSYNSLCYAGSWNESFKLMYKLMKTDNDGTEPNDETNGLIEYLNKAGRSPLVTYYPYPTWNDMKTEIINGYPFIFGVYDHYLYDAHDLLALGYVSFTYSTIQESTGIVYSRYLRVADGWSNKPDRYIHVRVGQNDHTNREIIAVHP